MIRFMLRLAGALLVEKICERIRPVQWELAPLGKPDGWLRYYGPAVTGMKGPTQVSKPLPQGDFPRWPAQGATVHFTSTDPYWKDE